MKRMVLLLGEQFPERVHIRVIVNSETFPFQLESAQKPSLSIIAG